MLPLLSSAQMRAADCEAIESFHLPELVLMEHAALAVASAVETRFGRSLAQTRGVVVAGPGNNGGDALAAARLLHEKGCTNLYVVLLEHGRELTESTKLQLRILGRLGVAWGRELSSELLQACDWIIDGLLGTGLSRDVEGALRESIETLNAVAGRKWVVSIDLPSGLDADTGNPRGVAVRASHTVALGFLKRGQVTGDAADYAGQLTLSPIQIPRAVDSAGWSTFLYGEEDARRLPHRREASHKGSFGHVAVVAGTEEQAGASALASLGALRAGTGLVTVLGEAETVKGLRPRLAREVMTHELSEKLFIDEKYQAVVLGPGLGNGNDSWKLVKQALLGTRALVLDADALNAMAAHSAEAASLLEKREPRTTLPTPHPKEAARLLGVETNEIQRDRYAAIERLFTRYAAVVLLKGRGTLVGSREMPTVVVTSGDTGLAKGGTGDILSGIAGAFLAQGLKATQAAPLAAFLHGRASERLTQRYGQTRSSLASEIADELPWVLRELA